MTNLLSYAIVKNGFKAGFDAEKFAESNYQVTIVLVKERPDLQGGMSGV